ncbi:hypothetical protein FRC0141_01355 [Corynebacterium diphtheriae]|uniref:hypothetical protein n=1 Tax=Corynebacterium diphtheriae TaxID=1717 RepID=UPI0013CBC9D2|nr:hypothetical protein [Corynebacterium diphtheriae]MBG9312935.1 hypothetical protein [Corynebacterium diphtheriae bv. mitis]CAB0689767.1 hypothetical protein FRC0024_00924 [Corynebacterium diphtheriae]CAB0696902.1 hypothetical protein FRC0069_01265 [Corynebacterium diphtheriae]CAB0700085.1 hypothetical protein FRC0032_01424 [Corynebacterium diphtheriae]CAB0725987.1 hypothetical protein FRC0087_01200 [Corynebacterium diphtheriae]
MKLFSRKAIVAATTAVAISAGSLSAPAMADEKPALLSQTVNRSSEIQADGNKQDKTKDTIATVKSVLSIISTVVAILGALFPLASQIMKKFGIGK